MAGQVKDFLVRTRLILPALLLFYFIIVLAQASLKLVWGDELFTFYIARQPGWAGIWHALAAGADPNPPLIHILVQASVAAFGVSEVAIRLPAILCVLLAIVAMWCILRRWVSPIYAAIGILAFMATRGFDYSYDARSYAPMMGFAMVSLALWMRASDCTGWRRAAALGGMTAALALGISSNYYCVLAFFPIAAGEALHSWQQRRIRPGVWFALLAGALPLLAYRTLIRHNIAEFGPHAWNRPRLSMVGLSYLELVEGVFWPVLAMGVFALWKRRSGWQLPRPETLALATLLLYPILGFLIAIAGAGLISPRCVAPVCCGFGLAAGVLSQHLFGENRRATIAVLSLFLVWVAVRESFCATLLLEQRRSFLALRDRVADDDQHGVWRILISDSSFALPLYFYSEPQVQRRIVFPIDFAAIHALEPDDSGEQNLWAGRHGIFPFPILPVAESGIDFPGPILIARPDGWLAQAVRHAGSRLEIDGAPDAAWNRAWYGTGGVMSPMAHPDTRILYMQVSPGGIE